MNKKRNEGLNLYREANRNMRTVFNGLNDRSSNHQKIVTCTILASYRRMLLHQKKNQRLFENCARLAQELYEGTAIKLDVDSDLVTSHIILNKYLYSELEEYIQDNLDVYKCFLKYKEKRKDISTSVEKAVNLYQLVSQILDNEWREFLRLKKSLFEIIGAENFVCDINSIEVFHEVLYHFRKLNSEKVIDDSTHKMAVDLVKQILIYYTKGYAVVEETYQEKRKVK